MPDSDSVPTFGSGFDKLIHRLSHFQFTILYQFYHSGKSFIASKPGGSTANPDVWFNKCRIVIAFQLSGAALINLFTGSVTFSLPSCTSFITAANPSSHQNLVAPLLTQMYGSIN